MDFLLGLWHLVTHRARENQRRLQVKRQNTVEKHTRVWEDMMRAKDDRGRWALRSRHDTLTYQ